MFEKPKGVIAVIQSPNLLHGCDGGRHFTNCAIVILCLFFSAFDTFSVLPQGVTAVIQCHSLLHACPRFTNCAIVLFLLFHFFFFFFPAFDAFSVLPQGLTAVIQPHNLLHVCPPLYQLRHSICMNVKRQQLTRG
jgi:hypothetical protein